MARIKLTKNELRDQQYKQGQLKKYLPTLQLKKTMLQIEVNNAELEIQKLTARFQEKKKQAQDFQKLLSDRGLHHFFSALYIESVEKSYENIAGIEIPKFEKVHFALEEYFFYDTPLWWDAAIDKLKDLKAAEQQISVAREKKEILAKELREVSIRVNLFEKILIPRTQANIKKIKIFLGDQELAAVSQAKVAKAKIQGRKKEGEFSL
ncbi:MAG: V-type ATP synthase subunit D [Simkaniaceae bacterium]